MITGDVPMGATLQVAQRGIRLLTLVNDVAPATTRSKKNGTITPRLPLPLWRASASVQTTGRAARFRTGR